MQTASPSSSSARVLKEIFGQGAPQLCSVLDSDGDLRPQAQHYLEQALDGRS